MARARSYSFPDLFLDGIGTTFFAQESNVLFPRHSDHHPQTVSVRCIQQPSRRHGISPDTIKTLCRHGREIRLHCFWSRNLVPVLVRREGSVIGPPNE